MRTINLTTPRWSSLRMALTEMGMASMIGASLAMLGVLASLGPPADLWWSWLVQVAALATGAIFGALLGWRALRRSHRSYLTGRRKPPTRSAAPA